jgi:hypothetical protein
MKKNLLFIALFPIILASCNGTVSKINFPYSDQVRTQTGELLTLPSYNDLSYKVNNGDTFILVIGNSTCGCTIELQPVIETWSEQTRIPVYYLEYTLLLFQPEKFEIPLVSSNAPIVAIFVEGELTQHRAYNTRTSSENALFYDLNLLYSWFESHLNLPSFQFLTKPSFDALFETTGETLLLYIGREDCPDCSYAFNTFLTPFLLETSNLPPMYGLDVMQNGIRVPVIPGQEASTGNNTPGWEQFKSDYGLNTIRNTTFGYATGFVPTFMIVETNGSTIAEDPSIIKDMLVVYNDSTRDSEGNWTTQITRTFFDGSRPLQYTDLNLTNYTLASHTSSGHLRDLLRPYHEQALDDFFDYYIPLLTSPV